MKKISFSPPDIGQSEIDEVIEVLKSGWITTGPKTKLFEEEISKYIGVEKAVCLNSATACEEINLRILGIGEGDEVILPAYTYTATASAVHHVGAKIIMIDCAKDSFEMDYEAVEKAITARTKAIIPVDIAGIPCNYKKLFEIVKSKKNIYEANTDIQKAIGRIAIVADCAHSFGASLDGLMAGNIADFSSFSFHAVKNLTTGEGGASTWKNISGVSNEEIYKRYQLYSLHGQSKDALEKTKLGSWEYDIVEPLYKCNMTDIMAGIGLAQLNRYKSLLNKRREIIEKYDEAFKNTKIKTLKHYKDRCLSTGHLYLTRVEGIDERKRNLIIEEMAKVGIATNVHYKPLPLLTAYKKLGFDIKNYPNAYNNYKNEITLPLHTQLKDEDVDYIIKHYLEKVDKIK